VTGHVGDLLEANAARWPGRLAIVEPGGASITFGDLGREAATFSAGLDEAGLRRGARVLLLLPIGIPLYIALLGILWGGRTAVLVDPSADRRRLDAALARVGLHAFVGSRKAHLLRFVLKATRGLDLYVAAGGLGPFARDFPAGDGPGERRSPPEGEPALITFTTGTTGVPKAIGRSHAFLLAQHDVLAEHMGLGPDDIDLPTLPVFLLNSLGAGATCVLPDGDLRDVASLDPDRLLAQIEKHGVTTTSGSPAYLAGLAARVRARGRPVPSVTKVFVGGARVRGSALADLAAAFPEARVEIVYGSTEAEPIASLDADEALAGPAGRETEGSCVGHPVPGVSVRIVGDDGADVDDGTPGEVWVAGAHVNGAYYKDAQSDAQNKVRDGERVWHRTGDVAWRDPMGRLWLLGRLAERVGGRWPFPVEAAAEGVPGVLASALVEVDGKPVLAFTGTAPRDDVSSVTQIADVRRVTSLPVDPRHRAKIDRARLASILAIEASSATAGK